MNKFNNEKGKVYYEDIPIDFKRDGNLMRKKLITYLPAMIMTNMSNLLLVAVDGIVVGNFLGSEAFASVNIFGPAVVLIGAITAIASTGIATCLSNAIGSNKQEEINRIRGASFQFMILMAVVVSIIQIPMIKFIIDSYHLDPKMNSLVWEYAIGIMICTPLGIISTVGVYQLQIVGKMRVLMRLSIMEGLANLIFDLFFIAGLKIGVGGAGFGTACANLLRASVTVIYLSRYTNIYKRDGYKTNVKDYIEIIRTGLPGCISSMVSTFESYCMMRILLHVAGTDGCVISGVAAFCSTVAAVLINGLQGSMRPLVGLLAGEDDRVGLSKLMESGFRHCIIGGGLSIITTMLFAPYFYYINGIRNIPDGGITAIRFFSLSFIVSGFNIVINLFLTNRKDLAFVSRLNLIGSAILPLIAFIISRVAPSSWLWLSYAINETIIFVILYARFFWWKKKDMQEDYESEQDKVLYMTVTPDKAITASKAIRDFANEYDINPMVSNRVSLCIEEMVAYADRTKDSNRFEQHLNDILDKASKDLGIDINKFSVQIMVRFKGKDAAIFTMLDDGHHIMLDADEEKRKLTTDNYELVRRLAKSFDYQYILDMNYATIEFDAKDKKKVS